MPRANDVSAIFDRFIENFRAVLKKEVTHAVARASKEVLKGKKRVKALSKKLRKRPTSKKLRRSKALNQTSPRLRWARHTAGVNPALAGKPGYSKYGKKLGRPAKGKAGLPASP